MPERLVHLPAPHWLREMATNARTRMLSTKRGVMIASAAVLLIIALMIGLACGLWIAMEGDLGWGAVFALASIVGTLAALADRAYRKPELPFPPVGVEAPAASGGEASRGCADIPSQGRAADGGKP